jgi:NitT/TauT family transport system substrate-binding protein
VKRKPVIPLLMGIIVILLVASFFTRKEKTSHLRIGYVPATTAAPLYIAEERGFFKNEKIDTTIIPCQGAVKQMEALLSEDIDAVGFMFTQTALTIEAQEPGFLVFLKTNYVKPEQYQLQLVAGIDSGINSIYDLKGKVITELGGGISGVLVKLILRSAGLTIDDVRVVNMPLPQMAQAIVARKVDAAILSDPFTSLGLRDGSLKIIKKSLLTDYYLNPSPIAAVAVRREYYDRNKETVKRFILAYEKAIAYMKEYPEETRQIVIKRHNLPEDLQLLCTDMFDMKKVNHKDFAELQNKLYKEGGMNNKAELDKLVVYPD